MFNDSGDTIMSKSNLEDDVAKLLGNPPYNNPANICWNDNYFAKWLKDTYGEIAVDKEIKKQSRITMKDVK